MPAMHQEQEMAQTVPLSSLKGTECENEKNNETNAETLKEQDLRKQQSKNQE